MRSILRRLSDALATLTVCSLVAAGAAQIQPGALDPGFGAGGGADNPFGNGLNSTSEGWDVVVQDDGKIIAVGYAGATGGSPNFAVARYSGQGAPDHTFGMGGKVTTVIGSGSIATSVALQSDGKICVAGYANNGSDDEIALARYLENGELDGDFGEGGKAITPVGSGHDRGYRVAVQSDGKILVAGDIAGQAGNTDMVVLRYTANGEIDPSFGMDGKVVTDFGGSQDRVRGLAVQSDGKIIVAGSAGAFFELLRYTDSGEPDPTFGTEGKTGQLSLVGSNEAIEDLVLREDGRILVVGNSSAGILLAQFTTTGVLDLTFGGGDGVGATGPLPSMLPFAQTVAVRRDGKILVGGYAFDFFMGPPQPGNKSSMVVYYTPDGDIDTSLGTHPGVAMVANGFGRSVAIRKSGGSVVVGGVSQSPSKFSVLGFSDEVTDTPTLTSPATNTMTKGSVLVDYTLPESALDSGFNAQLIFKTPTGLPRTLHLRSAWKTAGQHIFSFNPTDPTGTSGGAVIGSLLFGSETEVTFSEVTVSYRDRTGNPIAAATNTNFTIDIATRPAEIVRPESESPFGGAEFHFRKVIYKLPEVALPDSVEVTFDDGTVPRVLMLRGMELAGSHTLVFHPADPVGTASPAGAITSMTNGPSIPDGGPYVVSVTYQDALGNTPATSLLMEGITVDTTTEPPTLTKPAANSFTNGNVTVDFTLPENADGLNARLIFDDGMNPPIELAVSGGLALAGRHRFEFNPAMVTDATSGGAIEMGTSDSIPDGTYTVTLSYRDELGNPAASAVSTNVTLDHAAPTLDLSPRLAAVNALGMATMPDLRSIAADATGIAAFTQTVPMDEPLSFGRIIVEVSATDNAGNTSTGSLQLTIGYERPGGPKVVSIAASTEDVATAATFGAAAPTGAKLATFSAPAISDNRFLVAKGTFALGRRKFACIYEEDTAGASGLVAYQGSDAPGIAGAKFKSFLDPLISPDGMTVLFAGKVAGGEARTGDDEGVWRVPLSSPPSTAELLLREGRDMPGLPASVKLKSVVGLSLRGDGVLALVKLARQPGLVTAASDIALVRVLGPAAGVKLLRTDDPITIGTLPETKIKTILSLAPAQGSPGQGRWHANGLVLAKITLADKRSAIVQFDDAGAPTVLAESGGDAGDGPGTDADWARFGVPGQSGVAGEVIALGALALQPGSVTKADDSAIGVATQAGPFNAEHRESRLTPLDSLYWVWASFSSPVINDYGRTAFLGTIKGRGGQRGKRTTLWYGDAANPDSLVTLHETNVPDEMGHGVDGDKFVEITSYAVPHGSDSGVVFVARLSGAFIAPSRRLGLYALDSQSSLLELLRTGNWIGTQRVKNFSVLNAVPGAYGVARSTNSTGSVAVVVTFTDNEQALLRIDVP